MAHLTLFRALADGFVTGIVNARIPTGASSRGDERMLVYLPGSDVEPHAGDAPVLPKGNIFACRRAADGGGNALERGEQYFVAYHRLRGRSSEQDHHEDIRGY